MSISSDKSRRTGFRPDQVADYERRRYRGFDQRLVDARERRILKRIFARLRQDGFLLDADALNDVAAGAAIERGLFAVSRSALGSGFSRPIDAEVSSHRNAGPSDPENDSDSPPVKATEVPAGKISTPAAADHANRSSPVDRRRSLVMDLPSGYGRMTGLIQSAGARPVDVDISFSMVARAVERARRREFGAPEFSNETAAAVSLDHSSPGRVEPAIGSRSLASAVGPASPASYSASPWGVVADVTKGLPFRDGAFDAILCLRLFHHFHDEAARRAALQEFGRVSSSAVLLSYYRATWLHRLQRRIRRLTGRGGYKIKMLPGSAFAREAEAAGFRVLASHPLWRGLHAQTIAVLTHERTGRESERSRCAGGSPESVPPKASSSPPEASS